MMMNEVANPGHTREDPARGFSNPPGVAIRRQLEEVACTHCQLPVPRGLLVAEAEHQFCCNGCKAVWNLLNSHGLEAFYTLCNQLNSAPLKAEGAVDDFTEFDDPVFCNQNVRVLSSNLCEARLLLEGIHCAACIWL